MTKLGDEIKQQTEKFGRDNFCLTEKGETALKILGSYRGEPPTVISYYEILDSVVKPVTKEQEESVRETAEFMGFDFDQFKIMKEGNIEKVNTVLNELVNSEIIGKVSKDSFAIQGIGSKSEKTFSALLTLEFEGCLQAGPLTLISSSDSKGVLKEVIPGFGDLISELSEKGFIKRRCACGEEGS